MNLTQVIQETGRRVRRGKMPAEKPTNTEIKQVLETALAVMCAGVHADGRLEIQNVAVIERVTTPVKRVRLNGQLTRGERTRWLIRVSDNTTAPPG